MTKHVTIEDTGPMLEAIAAHAYGDDWATTHVADKAVIKTDMLTALLPGLNVFLDQVNAQLAPTPCDMRQGDPYDFAWCTTHDTTFAIGDKCKFDGREAWEVYEEEARDQRGRAVRAEMRTEWSIDVEHLEHQREWSRSTFGPGARTLGVLDHIREELDEVEAAPHDVEEWADVLILAFDGAWRAGHEPAEIIGAIKAKQERNERRTWPDWRDQSPDHKINALPDQPEHEQSR